MGEEDWGDFHWDWLPDWVVVGLGWPNLAHLGEWLNLNKSHPLRLFGLTRNHQMPHPLGLDVKVESLHLEAWPFGIDKIYHKKVMEGHLIIFGWQGLIPWDLTHKSPIPWDLPQDSTNSHCKRLDWIVQLGYILTWWLSWGSNYLAGVHWLSIDIVSMALSWSLYLETMFYFGKWGSFVLKKLKNLDWSILVWTMLTIW